MQHYYILYFWLPPLVSNDYRWWFSPAILYGGIRQYHVVEEPEEGPWKMIYGSIESVLTKSIDSWTAWRKAFTFHLIFLQVISKLRIVMMWHAVLHHYDLFRHGAGAPPLQNYWRRPIHTYTLVMADSQNISFEYPYILVSTIEKKRIELSTRQTRFFQSSTFILLYFLQKKRIK